MILDVIAVLQRLRKNAPEVDRVDIDAAIQSLRDTNTVLNSFQGSRRFELYMALIASPRYDRDFHAAWSDAVRALEAFDRNETKENPK